MFRKPKKHLRAQRRIYNSDDEEDSVNDSQNVKPRDSDSNGASAAKNDHLIEDNTNLKEIQSNISKFKESKSLKKKKRTEKSANKTNDGNTNISKGSTLSFEQDLEGDDGEVFQVKKSSQSRRLIKQLKAEKKAKKNGSQNILQSSTSASEKNFYSSDELHQTNYKDSTKIDIQDKDSSASTKRMETTTWTVSGKEAEALHMEEEDSDGSSEDDVKDPLQKLLQSGAIPDANAIHAARKKREAMRAGGNLPETKPRSYIPLKDSTENDRNLRSPQQDDDDSDVEESRINFTGVRSAAAIKNRQIEELDTSPSRNQSKLKQNVPFNEEEDHWEQQQIRKAMKANQLAHVIGTTNGSPLGISSDPFHDGSNDPMLISGNQPHASSIATNGSSIPQHSVHFGSYSDSNFNEDMQKLVVGMKKPATYNLQGIKDRLKERITTLIEVNRRHESDLDRAHDDMFTSRDEIIKYEESLPKMATHHRYYQDLRGYVTDLVECYDEKLMSIKYLEEKFYQSKSEITKKLIERRREDVRDQMKELSNTKPQLLMNQEETIQEEARQRRAAEREGRRRRRLQQRKANQTYLSGMKHADGMSSDDEMSSLDQSTLGKVRQDVENQARTVMSDVIEEFSSLDCVCDRLEQWRDEDMPAYIDAFAPMCLPKIFSPLVRLQLLFWNPLTEHNNIETMPWYKTLATYADKATLDQKNRLEDECSSNGSKFQNNDEIKDNIHFLKDDPDSKLLSLVIEKVVIVRVTNFVRSAYDPLSTSQTLKLTGLLERFISLYPTVNGQSRQVRELLEVVKEKLRTTIDNDVYIPFGYPKHFVENPLSGHALFLQRQFWGAFKLYRNVLAWHGILSDSLVADMALNSILNRYLLIGLGVMISCSDYEQVRNKCRHIVGALPAPWIVNPKDPNANRPEVNTAINKIGLQRFTKFLVTSFSATSTTFSTKCAEDIIKLLRILGAKEEASIMEGKLVEKID